MARKQIEYPAGQKLPGTKYVVVKKLGQGGMGVVLEVVKDPGIRGVVKIIHPALAADPDFRRRFFDEVRILAKLDHPNIVKVTDYDELEDGTPYFVMELLHGSTVRQVFKSKSVQPAHLYQIMRGLLEGLSYAHTHEPPIVHRDIKTDNVFIHLPAHGDPCIKVIDFGVAGGEAIVEEKGLFVGTPGFAAPEQLRGKPVTPQADLYSAALILYEGLAGRGPFDDVPLIPSDDGSRMKASIRAHLQLSPPSVLTFAPWAGDALDKLLMSALAKDPRDRPQSAYAFAMQLFVLQFLGDNPASMNATVPTLETMTEAPPSEPAMPAHKRDPTMREERPQRGPNDTVVDHSLAALENLLDVRREDDRATLDLRGSALLDTMASQSAPDAVLPHVSPAAPVAASEGPAPLGMPRSFQEAEAAAKRQAATFAPRGRSVADVREHSPYAETEARARRVAASEPPPPPKRVRQWHLWLLAVGLPAGTLVVLAIAGLLRAQSTPAPATTPPTTASIRPLPRP